MNTAAEEIRSLMLAKGWSDQTCSGCQRLSLRPDAAPFVCLPCYNAAWDQAIAENWERDAPVRAELQKAAQEAQEARAREEAERRWESLIRWQNEAPQRLWRWLEERGMSRRDLEAGIDTVPAALLKAIEKVRTETTGFGLSGRAGCGKTYTMAALVKARAMDWLRRHIEKGPEFLQGQGLAFDWTSWPEHVRWMRAQTSLGDEGFKAVEWETARLGRVALLVIDDLGAERMKGGYDEDWAASHLDAIVDERYSARLPIWWTSNLGREALSARYGERLISRLCGDAPLIEMPEQKDRRRERRVRRDPDGSETVIG